MFKIAVALLAVAAPVFAAARPANVFSRTIVQLGGNAVNPAAYPNTLAGFQAYLTASGVRSVTAAEMTQPHHAAVAARLGFTSFLPPQSWWERGAALALLTQSIEKAAGAHVTMRNWWRPAAYNADPRVGGAKNGDHPGAYAVDLDYPSVRARQLAETYLRTLNRQYPWMQLSFGFGPATTHVGIASPRGHREWHYAGWTPARTVAAS